VFLYIHFLLDQKTNQKNQNDCLGNTHGFLLFTSEFVNVMHFAKAPFADALLLVRHYFMPNSIHD